MAQTRLIQGSWEELSARAEEFKDRTDLMLIIPGDTEIKKTTIKEGMNLGSVKE